jgi:hypothetical protein
MISRLTIGECVSCSTTRDRSPTHRAVTRRSLVVPRGTSRHVTADSRRTYGSTGDLPALRRAAVAALFPALAAALAAKHGGQA